MHILTFKIPTIRHVWQLIQQGDYTCSIDLKEAYLDILVLVDMGFTLMFPSLNFTSLTAYISRTFLGYTG